MLRPGRARAEPGLPVSSVSQLDRGPYRPRVREGFNQQPLLPSLSRPMPCSSSMKLQYSTVFLAAENDVFISHARRGNAGAADRSGISNPLEDEAR